MKQRDYTQALTLGFLTKWYDSIVNFLGFGKRYYLKVTDYVKPKDQGRILDVGTGTANLAIAIKRKYPHAKITGIDPDKEILEIAKKKIKKEGLDMVSSLTIHHIPKMFKREAFSEMRRVLKKNGTILIIDFGIPKNIF